MRAKTVHYLFYGENTFSISEKVKNLVTKFVDSYSDLNVLNLDGASLTLETYTGAVNSASFFGSKKLILINNLLLENKDVELKKKIAKSLEKIPETSTVLFVECGLPDMRSALFKGLNQPKIAQKFDPLTGNRLTVWIKDRVEKSGGKISETATEKLIIFVGSNLWRLENEIAKLLLYKQGSIEDHDIDEMVCAENNASIFNYIDAVAEGNSAKALSMLNSLIAAGEEGFYIFTMIVYQFRNLLFVSELSKENMPASQIASEAKIHPFVVRKSQGFIKRFAVRRLQKIYNELQQIDYKIKSGVLDLDLALDYLTVKLCKR